MTQFLAIPGPGSDEAVWQTLPSSSAGVISAKVAPLYDFNSAALYNMQFPTIDLNTMAGQMLISGENNQRFTAQVDGLFECNFTFNLTSDGAFNVYLRVNGNPFSLFQMDKVEGERNMSFHYIANLVTDDYIEWEIEDNSVNPATSGRSYMSIKKI